MLGISSGASLGVALLIMGYGTFSFAGAIGSIGIATAAFAGAILILLCVLLVANRFANESTLLIFGIMLTFFTSAIVDALQSRTGNESLRAYVSWGMGNFANCNDSELIVLAVALAISIILSLTILPRLNLLLLGENYAKSLGLNYTKARFVIILATSILAGSITAFAGPIAFVGLAVPHIAKLVFQTSNHLILFWSTLLFGAMIMLVCDSISQLPNSAIVIPINAITSILGAPIVIWLLIRKRKLMN
jgi:iron complex transport system permease protein